MFISKFIKFHQVDTYVSEGPINICISYTSPTNPDPVIIEKKRILNPNEDNQQPKRHLIVVPGTYHHDGNEERTFSITWTNANWLSANMIVLSLSKSSSSIHKALDFPDPPPITPEYEVVTVNGVISSPTPRTKNSKWAFNCF